MRFGVPRVLEGGWVGGAGQPGGRARPHHAWLELALVQGGDPHAAAAGGAAVGQDAGDVRGVGAPRHHGPLVDAGRGHAGHRRHSGLDLLAYNASANAKLVLLDAG